MQAQARSDPEVLERLPRNEAPGLPAILFLAGASAQKPQIRWPFLPCKSTGSPNMQSVNCSSQVQRRAADDLVADQGVWHLGHSARDMVLLMESLGIFVNPKRQSYAPLEALGEPSVKPVQHGAGSDGSAAPHGQVLRRLAFTHASRVTSRAL